MGLLSSGVGRAVAHPECGPTIPIPISGYYYDYDITITITILFHLPMEEKGSGEPSATSTSEKRLLSVALEREEPSACGVKGDVNRGDERRCEYGCDERSFGLCEWRCDWVNGGGGARVH